MSENLMWPMGVGKLMAYLQDSKGGEIAEVRNGIVDEMLEYDRTCNPISDLFWLDDDVLVMPGAVKELYALRTDIATGTYFLKEPGTPQPLLWPGEFSEGPLLPFVPNRIFPVRFCGMGLTMVKTMVYRRMQQELGDVLGKDKYGRTQWYRTASDNDITVDATGVVGEGYTEDWWFLHHAAMLGISPVAATTKHAFGFHVQNVFECDCGFQTSERKLAYRHMGENLSHHVKEDITGFPQDQWRQWVARGCITWQTPEGEVVWD